jgi:predicted AAA+ superfamily ATPase
MKRMIIEHLNRWKDDKNRLPLIVRGARQVGKSFSVEEFGNTAFDNCLTVDFDLYPEYIDCFSGSLEPQRICTLISAISKQDIIPGKTLLFLDEIQQCPRAIMSLRYFYEKYPTLHVISAGSLLEFALESQNMHMPVGRVQYVYMYPLTFKEFLHATGNERLVSIIESGGPYEPVIHEQLLSVLKIFMVTGGMPAVVKEYCESGNLQLCARKQAVLSQTYRDDFGKYASFAKIPHLQKLFTSIPRLVGKKFKYSAVDETIKSRELKSALELLEMAGVVYRIKQTSGFGLPAEAGASDRNFKVIFLDVGLMQNLCGLSGELLSVSDTLAVHAGSVTEQFVGQEIIANSDPFTKLSLYYWAREQKSSSAEVDYLFQHGSHLFPIEVKSGKSGTLRSLNVFLKEYNSLLGIKVSQENTSLYEKLLSIPLYGLSELKQEIDKNISKD